MSERFISHPNILNGMDITVNPSRYPDVDFEVATSDLERISFDEIRVGDLIKVTHGDGNWDYRHVHNLRCHPTDPDKSYAIGFGYQVGSGLGGCEISADRMDLVLERVEPNTALRLLEYYQRKWAHPEVPLHLHPRAHN